MLLDGLSSSHPISQEVEQATDIDRVFDWIAYKKVALRGFCRHEGFTQTSFLDVSVEGILPKLFFFFFKSASFTRAL